MTAVAHVDLQKPSIPARVVPDGMSILLHDGSYFLVPAGITRGDLEDPLVRTNPRIHCSRNLDELLSRFSAPSAAHSIEFLGWLPQFEDFGNCGEHPQFLASLRRPPEGWAFVQNPPFRAFRPEVLWDRNLWHLLGRLNHLFGLSLILKDRSDTVLVTREYRQSAYHVFLRNGVYFGIPSQLVPANARHGDPQLINDPAVASAPDLPSLLEVIEARVPGHDFGSNPSRPVTVFQTYYGLNISIVQYRGIYIVWPNSWGPFSFWAVHRDALSVDIERRLHPAVQIPKPIPEWKWKLTMARLAMRSLANGARWSAILEFVGSREPTVNRRLAMAARGAFVTSVPFVSAPIPWVIEIEDSTSLFHPFLQNGKTAGVNAQAQPVFPVLKAFLEQRYCRGIITHIRSTAEGLRTLFRSRAIDAKTCYCPLGYIAPYSVPARTVKDANDPVHVLFTSSWHQNQVGFFVRGGIDLLEAFDSAAQKDSRLCLTLRCLIPAGDCQDRFNRLREKYGSRVRNLSSYLAPEQWRDLLLSSDIFALPAARIHVVSLLEAMAHGLVPLTSDGWAIEEYVDDRETGLIVRGRAGKVSWAEPASGVLREDYSSMYSPDRTIIAQMATYLEELAGDPVLRFQLGSQAQEAVRTRFTLERWNAMLKTVFERF
jgi:glycosyltransferase involved in cell wall biosynthesis